MNAWSAALQSGSILLREGLEAMLIIAALAAIVRRAGAIHQLKELYAGALLAVLASLAAAIVFEMYLNGVHDDRLEAAVMIVASGLMLYMSGWLLVRKDPRAWQAEMRHSAVCLVGIYGAMQWLALRLPLRPLFLVTSTFLFIMGLRLIGGAVQELQEQLYVPYDAFAVPDWLVALGINPTWEAVGAQLVVAVAAMLSTLVTYARRRPRTAAPAGVTPPPVPQS